MKKKIGLLFSLTGTTSIVEVGQYQASLLAIEHAKTNYGVELSPIIANIESNPEVTAKAAYQLLRNQKVDTLIGCYTSACRKAIIPVLEEVGGSLLYPTTYEGQESHPLVFYFGSVPNQQVDPLLSWSISNISSQFVLVGSDYVYPRSTNKQVRNFIESAGGVVLRESYFPLGHDRFLPFMRRLKSLHRKENRFVVFSTLVGTSILSFYEQYRAAGLAPPIISPITSEVEIAQMDVVTAAGHYFSDAYPDQLGAMSHAQFVADYRRKFGNKSVNGIMTSAYDAIQFVARCFHDARGDASSNKGTLESLRSTIRTLPSETANRKILMDSHNQHAWLWSRVARVDRDGGIDVIWTSPGPMPPKPCGDTMFFPPYGDNPVQIAGEDPFCKLIGTTDRFTSCVRVARIAAKTPANVFLTGETGTGKELFARAIHEASSRKDHPFIAINCAGVPPGLMASELFGYEGGSFTGSKTGGSPGKFELARGGSLFLDEVAEMPIDTQGSLLRVLQEPDMFRVGGTKPIKVDVRIIAATNRDIMQQLTNKGFREDLYYRLNVFPIDIPPLRMRKDDVILIARSFLKRFNQKYGTDKVFSTEVLNLFLEYAWPGNVRELSNVVERAFYVAQSGELIRPEHFVGALAENGGGSKLRRANDVVIAPTPEGFAPTEPASIESYFSSTWAREKEFIKQTIVMNGLNMSQAARVLGISRSTLYRKVKKLDINVSQRMYHYPVKHPAKSRISATMR